MFSLLSRGVTLKSVNPRMEHHGDELVPACDIHVKFTAANSFLTEFDAGLKAAIYHAGDQADLDSEHLPSLRFPHLGKLSWGQEFIGYSMTVHDLVSPALDRKIELCDINKVSFDCKDGGSVEYAFKVAFSADDLSELVGWLAGHIEQEIVVSLMPPAADSAAGAGVAAPA